MLGAWGESCQRSFQSLAGMNSKYFCQYWMSLWIQETSPQKGIQDIPLPRFRSTLKDSRRKTRQRKMVMAVPRRKGLITNRSGFGKGGTTWNFIFLSWLGTTDRDWGELILVRILTLHWLLPVSHLQALVFTRMWQGFPFISILVSLCSLRE